MGDELQEAYEKAWSIENMAGHGREGLETRYIGSVTKKGVEYKLFKDSKGGFWYQTKTEKDLGLPKIERYKKRLA